MIIRFRRWKGGSTYEIEVQPERPFVERLPVPGERIKLAEMGWVTVTDAKNLDDLRTGFLMPEQRRWRLVVQTPGVGPQFDNL